MRVLRRRLDIPPLPFMQPDGAMYLLDADGTLIPFAESHDESFGDQEHDGQELGVLPSSGIPSSQDYVARARYLAGVQHGDAESVDPASALEARRAIAKLERATTELRQGILSEWSIQCILAIVVLNMGLDDEDGERKTQAKVLLNAYSRELERRRLEAGAQGLLISGDGKCAVPDSKPILAGG